MEEDLKSLINPAYATAPYEEILLLETIEGTEYRKKYPRRFMDPEGKIEVLPFLPEPE